MQMRKRALTAALLFLTSSTYPVCAQESFDSRSDNAPLTGDPFKAGNRTKSDSRSGAFDEPRPERNQGQSGSPWAGFYAGSDAGGSDGR